MVDGRLGLIGVDVVLRVVQEYNKENDYVLILHHFMVACLVLARVLNIKPVLCLENALVTKSFHLGQAGVLVIKCVIMENRTEQGNV